MNKTLKKNENLKLELNNNLNLIENKSQFMPQNFERESRYDGLKMRKEDPFLSRSNFFQSDPFNSDPLFVGNNLNFVNPSDYPIRDDLESENQNYPSPLNKSMKSRAGNNSKNLEEGSQVVKISKDLRKEKEEMFLNRKFQKI